ncbi:hypothetical protein HY212_02900 [Candidatus Pacearchaeota archaeon]|nr:hypothetical protein [Candidatus Pacearchaeota archaeon]
MTEMRCCYRNCSGKVPSSSETGFRIQIFKYCDENAGEKVLFPFFVSLYPIKREGSLEFDTYPSKADSSVDGVFERDICNKLLAEHASRILEELIKHDVVREVFLPPRVNTEYGFLVTNVAVPFISGYPYYEILPHQSLIERRRR